MKGAVKFGKSKNTGEAPDGHGLGAVPGRRGPSSRVPSRPPNGGGRVHERSPGRSRAARNGRGPRQAGMYDSFPGRVAGAAPGRPNGNHGKTPQRREGRPPATRGRPRAGRVRPRLPRRTELRIRRTLRRLGPVLELRRIRGVRRVRRVRPAGVDRPRRRRRSGNRDRRLGPEVQSPPLFSRHPHARRLRVEGPPVASSRGFLARGFRSRRVADCLAARLAAAFHIVPRDLCTAPAIIGARSPQRPAAQTRSLCVSAAFVAAEGSSRVPAGMGGGCAQTA